MPDIAKKKVAYQHNNVYSQTHTTAIESDGQIGPIMISINCSCSTIVYARLRQTATIIICSQILSGGSRGKDLDQIKSSRIPRRIFSRQNFFADRQTIDKKVYNKYIFSKILCFIAILWLARSEFIMGTTHTTKQKTTTSVLIPHHCVAMRYILSDLCLLRNHYNY